MEFGGKESLIENEEPEKAEIPKIFSVGMEDMVKDWKLMTCQFHLPVSFIFPDLVAVLFHWSVMERQFVLTEI